MFGPDDAFLTTILRLLRQLPIYPMFGRGLTRLQPAYVEDVAEAVRRTMQRAETPSTIFEFGGPRVYSYEEFLRAVAHQAGLAPRLIPIPFAVWNALAWASERFPKPLLTRKRRRCAGGWVTTRGLPFGAGRHTLTFGPRITQYGAISTRSRQSKAASISFA
jgi:nucleoside-diphosphate-sugar epimerase